MSPTSVRLPVLAPVVAALRDVFGDLPSTFRALSLMFALLVLLVELPMLFLATHAERFLEPGRQTLADMQKMGATTLDPLAPTPDVAAVPLGDMGGKLWVMAAGLTVYTLQMILLFCFMTGWYRQLLFNENRGGVIGMRLGRPEWDLMKTSLKAGLALLPFVFMAMMVVSAAYPNGDINGPPAFNHYPYIIAIAVITLYFRARLALAYPATMMGDTDAPVRQSWRLTKNQGWRLVLGNLLADVVMIGGIFLIFTLISLVLSKVLSPEQVAGDAPLGRVMVLMLKAVAELCMLFYVAVLSAYHARAYAYLVRSSSSSAVH